MLGLEKLNKKYVQIVLMLVIISSILLLNCGNKQLDTNCVKRLRERSKSATLAQEVIGMLKDSVAKWHRDSVFRFSGLNIDEDWYFDDLIMFNLRKNRAFSCIYKLNKDTSSTYNNIVNLYVAEFLNGRWKFYLNGMPSISYARMWNNNKAFTLEQIQQDMDKDYAKHLKPGKCEFEDDLVDKWFEGIENIRYVEDNFWREEYENKRQRDSVAKLNNGSEN